MGSEKKVQLISAEGENFEVALDVALMSQLVKEQLEDDCEDGQEIPLPNVKTPVLLKVIEFMNYHHATPMKEIPKPIKTKFEDVVEKWDLDFIDVPYEMIFELILAANYLDIKSLLELSCAKVSGIIFGKTPDQIRETFNIEQPFTPEEEKFIRDENKWPEE
ncbi:S-phase kinase-associated protein 1 [Saprolegnia diclina VS20]|uniref:S-phase kinase-associated protein 1 n=1 Tax=Saprolegnia diclina (strain VS20) TaxID=1156394 RepID=T0SC54_SAPDV|nr:S-phase kinase-associated protein 1 [Saprolegnia diclina VS20]EQC40382.1 S-phase kinase-associated protein 1 [Saprolegnia diclina VS20]|eukprot:XP_008606081.1 S-phase kinase-associated protein 1 [Saprolegnia diclina VS20]